MKATENELAIIESIIRTVVRESWTIDATAWEAAEKAIEQIKTLIDK